MKSLNMKENHTISMIFLVGNFFLSMCYAYAQEETNSPAVTIPILKYNNEPSVNGSYKWEYETGNGIMAQEEGYLKASEGEGEGSQFAKGSFSYIGPNNQTVEVQYTADENGFAPVGSHLPTPPPIPPEILASLEKNAADEAAGIFDDGKYKYDGSGKYKHDDSGKYKSNDKENQISQNNTDLKQPGMSIPSGGTTPGGTGKPAPPKINA